MGIKIKNLRISPQEEFAEICDGDYLVSNFGRVISLKNTRGFPRKEPIVLKTWSAGNGYECVALKNGKKHNVHRLVAEAFIPNPQNLSEVNHKDKNKFNNHVDNLEWCTRQYNVNYSKDDMKDRSRAIKVTNMQTKKVAYFASELLLNQFCGFTQRIVRECCHGVRENAYGCKFQFVEE